MLKIENGRFSECTFIEDLKNKNIVIKQYKNQEVNWIGTIVNTSNGSKGYSITCNNWNDGLIGFKLHNIEFAEIF